MKKTGFKCVLLSDIIINQRAATEGNQQTLDFIPGSNFLGIAAQIYDLLPPEQQLLIFHSGKVRFGDAHPSEGTNRSLKVPLSYYYPKLSKPTEELYVHHKISDFAQLNIKQLKQCRTGFYVFNGNKATEVKVDTSFAIKSAFDREKRRSADEQMFGYQSIDKGVTMLFEVAFDDDISQDLITAVTEALIGKKRVGRSRTAQYGLVDISVGEVTNVGSKPMINKELVIYADSRLIFLNDSGQPTFNPSLKHLGLKSGTINWQKSQIRTFQYAPWNYKRSCRDADRCGIEKGSVFVIDNAVFEGTCNEYVGSYQNEGFGRVIYNPDFFEVGENENGKAKWKIVKPNDNGNTNEAFEKVDNILTQYLQRQKTKEESEYKAYKLVNEFVENYGDLFKGKAFASQWGTIRSIAMQHGSKESLERELFTKTIQRGDKTLPFAYLTHGVAKEKWDERNRIKIFRDEFFKKVPKEIIQFAVINLAAEMAKICRRK
jgi:hypothetical protein